LARQAAKLDEPGTETSPGDDSTRKNATRTSRPRAELAGAQHDDEDRCQSKIACVSTSSGDSAATRGR
jgi:hypothetical protein